MRFRPCIDLHQGKVKQIVGSTLRDGGEGPKENFVAEHPPSFFASMFKKDGLRGGHVIMLGPGNEAAAKEALGAWPGGLQVGGGINRENALAWIEAGADAVIVTSYVFESGQVRMDRLRSLADTVGTQRLVLDLSCRRREGRYYIVTDRWQRFTEVELGPRSLEFFGGFCKEFLVHGVDVEGKCAGIEEELVAMLARYSPVPSTYAGGVSSMEDILLIESVGEKRVDYTVGSALDIFGGRGLKYRKLVEFNRSR